MVNRVLQMQRLATQNITSLETKRNIRHDSGNTDNKFLTMVEKI